jgi:tetratricopeptide (TPR) repeat protein
MESAQRATQTHDVAKAVQEYAKILQLDPNRAEAHVRLGMAYQDLGMPGKAANSFEHALKIDSGLPGVGVLLASVYVDLGRTQEAAPYLERSLDSNDELPVRLIAGEKLAECYFTMGEAERGLAVTERLRKLAPNDPDVLYLASKAYASMWNITIQQMLNSAADSYRLHQVLAEVFEAQEKYSDAAKEYRVIVQREPRLPGLHYRLGRMILLSNATGQADQEALAEFRKELEINPADVATLVEVGQVYLGLRALNEAAQYFSRASDIQPTNVKAIVGSANVSIAKKKFDVALAQLEHAQQLAPDDEDVNYNLMIVYRALGHSAEAKLAMAKFNSIRKRRMETRSSILNQLKGVQLQRSASIP